MQCIWGFIIPYNMLNFWAKIYVPKVERGRYLRYPYIWYLTGGRGCDIYHYIRTMSRQFYKNNINVTL